MVYLAARSATRFMGQHAGRDQYADGAIGRDQILLRDPLHVFGRYLVDVRHILIDHPVVAEHLIKPKLHRLFENGILAEDKTCLLQVFSLLFNL